MELVPSLTGLNFNEHKTTLSFEEISFLWGHEIVANIKIHSPKQKTSLRGFQPGLYSPQKKARSLKLRV